MGLESTPEEGYRCVGESTRKSNQDDRGFKGVSYEERLKEVGLTTLEKRRLRADLLEVFKILKGFEGIGERSFFERRKEGGSRGHKFMLFKKRFLTNLWKFSFGNRVVNTWNILPDNLVQAGTINGFKNGLDRYLRTYGGLK